MTPNEIREAFLGFYEQRGHSRLPSDSLVPENDPSLLFTGAGMNQFKDEFLGKGRRGLTRATTSQKCLRTGDLENVGRTAGHHSFFEMLGNFSFGDYFKREAIHWAWEWFTEVLSLPQERLVVTVYEDDDEAYAIWRDEVGLEPERIFRFGAKSNFWPANAPEAGPNGPCGPCSEIFYDYGSEYDSGNHAGDENPETEEKRFLEIGNLVFTQFDRRDGGELVPLPQRNIDTGLGFERLVAVKEGVYATMDSSLFSGILEAVAGVAGKESYDREGEDGVRCRRIADHVRAACFLIGDGVRPGNEGREYVLRRILRRAIRDGFGLGVRDAFLPRLVGPVVEAMGDAYSELKLGQALVERVLAAEEAQFRRTFENGMRRLDGAIAELEPGAELDAAVVFQLHDTFGFPVDVTAEILDERGHGFDRARYDELMQEQRDRSRDARKMTADIFSRGPVGELVERGVEATEFTGYGDPEASTREERRGTLADGRVVGLIVEGEAELRGELAPGESARLVLDRTPFYAESGGQVGDAGEITFPGGPVGRFRVDDCKAVEGYHLHEGVWEGDAPLPAGLACVATVDAERRDALRRNHTATHLLHKALKEVLGDEVVQSGSLVAVDRLRFDFTFDRALEETELREIEDRVNAAVLRNEPLVSVLMPVEEAKAGGAVALFGEKYPDPVRVVAVGDWSRELCGGTHCAAAGDIGSFRIASEASIASGIRRIEAVTGAESLRRMQEDRALVSTLARDFGVPTHEVLARVEKLKKDVKELKRRKPAAAPAFDALSGDPVEAGGLRVFVHVAELPRESIVAAGEAVAKRGEGGVAVVLVGKHGGKVAAVVAGSPAAVEAGFDAPKLIRALGGRGGGRPHMAQGTFGADVDADGLKAAVASSL